MGYTVRQYDNPADVFMRVLSINYPKQESDNVKLETLVKKYRSEQHPQIVKTD